MASLADTGGSGSGPEGRLSCCPVWGDDHGSGTEVRRLVIVLPGKMVSGASFDIVTAPGIRRTFFPEILESFL